MNERTKFIPPDALGETRETPLLRGEKQTPSINLLKQIQKIGSLPSELFRAGYTNFANYNSASEQEAKFASKETLPIKAALEVANLLSKEEDTDYSEPQESEIDSKLESLINNNDNAPSSQYIRRIAQWAAREPATRIGDIEKRLGRHFQEGGKINMTLLALLADLNVYKTDFAVDFDLIESLEKNHSFRSQLKDQIAILNRLNQKEANFLLHKILDFVKNYIITAQNNFQFEI